MEEIKEAHASIAAQDRKIRDMVFPPYSAIGVGAKIPDRDGIRRERDDIRVTVHERQPVGHPSVPGHDRIARPILRRRELEAPVPADAGRECDARLMMF
jgi:hypothetical protein